MASRTAVRTAAIAGLGGFAVIFGLAELSRISGALFIIAPFGASCVLVFGAPASPLAQPRNVIGGHLVSTAIGLATFAVLGATPLALGIGVGLAIAAMLLTRTTHPPAGADPIVVALAGASWPFLLTPVLAGSVAIVLASVAYHQAVTGVVYPARG
ncbi:HPP family protein [Hansschlegelia plantiphila]|uniref:Membrane protein n=1 Tax=Hansschlegelia plantiphila TaxID=374655 RepID=A0A9W6MXB6_9HYPH|nr:HPP family protein [Hansschlegelia plantiphila]GLK69866.1 membrane protein [Hansschlegelia plantiphila]